MIIGFWIWFIFCMLLNFYAMLSMFFNFKWRIGWNQVIWFMIGLFVAGFPKIFTHF
jgi:magnesium-transporting ATPase (P-type)